MCASRRSFPEGADEWGASEATDTWRDENRNGNKEQKDGVNGNEVSDTKN